MSQTYRITTDPSTFDFAVIHGFLSQCYWAKNIPPATLQKAIQHSLCFAVLGPAGETVGFARMITDRATFAYLADVFVLESHRNLGLGKQLIQYIDTHPDLQGLRRKVLATRDAHGLYRQFGYTELANPDTFMEVWDPQVYLGSN